MQFLEVNGARLHYQFDGAAGLPVLMLSNSLGANLAMWNLQMPVLVRYFRVLRYDTRGLGASEVTPGPYTMEQLGLDVIGLLDGLAIERVRFCGLSMGGMIGIWLGAYAPERLEKLALCNTSPHIGTAETWNSRIASIRQDGMAAVVDATLARWFRAETVAQHPERVAPIREMLRTASPEGYIANSAAVRDTDLYAALSRIQTPTLVIAGSDDASASPDAGRKLMEQIPDARLEVLQAAHLSNVDAAPAFTETLLQFMR